MTVPALSRPALNPVEPAGAIRALESALSGGPAVAPLPDHPTQAERAIQVLRPDVPLDADDIAAVVCTSGSTGEPKGVLLSRRAILASVEATHHRLGGRGRWLLALPIHYVAGLMVAARSLFSGSDPLDVGADLDGLRRPRPRRGATRHYLSIVPTQLVRALTDAELTDALGRLDAVLVGGGPAGPDLIDRARAASINVVTTYGMSETCGGCVYDGVPLDGVDVSIADDGRVSLGGSMLFSGYRLRPDLTEQTLTGRRLHTFDRGRIVGRRLEVLGRTDDVVVTGGLNVDLAAVEALIRAGSTDEVVVLGVPDRQWGTKIIAVTDRVCDLDALVRSAGGQLGAYARPRALIRLEAFPRTGSGKIDRPTLRAMIIDQAIGPE
ncbi:MAG: AMP-binding protein [Propionibacteriaceae bacterium]